MCGFVTGYARHFYRRSLFQTRHKSGGHLYPANPLQLSPFMLRKPSAAQPQIYRQTTKYPLTNGYDIAGGSVYKSPLVVLARGYQSKDWLHYSVTSAACG